MGNNGWEGKLQEEFLKQEKRSYLRKCCRETTGAVCNNEDGSGTWRSVSSFHGQASRDVASL